MRSKYDTLVTIIAVLIFIVMIIYSFIVQVLGFAPDMVFFLIVTLLLYKTYDRWRLNLPIYTIIIIGFILHSAGVFGWYHISPLPWAWERITHFFGILPITLLFYNYLKPHMDKKWITPTNTRLFIIVLFVSLGIGAAVEMTEFYGYLALGHGEGALLFGPGDGVIGAEGQDLIDVIGGGWINEGWDLTFNLFGALAGLFIMMIIQFVPREASSARP